MFLGHYGVALAAKRAAPETSLGWTVLASQWLDLLWPILLLVGVERVRIEPGLMPASALNFTHYPLTHSLLTVLGWGVLVGLVYWLTKRRARGAMLLAALVVSHWLLDAVVHRPDLPLWPGSDVLVGAGVWRSAGLTIALEFAFLAGGLAVYAKTTRPDDAVGRWGLWAMSLLLAVFFLSSFAGPPPSVSALAYGGLSLWLFVPWAAWVDRHRSPRHAAPSPEET
ncbi:MAG: metal-dependent hydrolase [Longimicrobiales bacterium]